MEGVKSPVRNTQKATKAAKAYRLIADALTANSTAVLTSQWHHYFFGCKGSCRYPLLKKGTAHFNSTCVSKINFVDRPLDILKFFEANKVIVSIVLRCLPLRLSKKTQTVQCAKDETKLCLRPP